MPRVDELPVPAQNQIRASRGEADPAQDKRRSLLQRLATVGFGRKEEQAPPAPRAEPQAPAPQPQQARPAEAPQRPAVSSVHAEYTKRQPAPQGYRPAQGNLDNQGRSPTPQRNFEDDQLEIPAFLRRQAN
jgi:cell division protein FtsZ